MKLSSTLLAIACLLMGLVIFQVPCNGQNNPKNLQVKVTEILSVEKKKVNCKAISMDGETVFVGYKYRGRNPIKVGTKITIYADYSDKECEKYTVKMRINN